MTSKTEIVKALVAIFNPICVVSKERLSSSGKSLENAPMDVVIGTREDAVGTVREGNARFHVDLLDTINPELFLDMRHVRLEVEDRFRAMSGASLRFLNLFSYTCSFSVHARLGGAAVATNADISGKILDKGRENYALNGLICVLASSSAVTLSNTCIGLKRKGSVLTASCWTRQALRVLRALTLTCAST